LNNKKTNIQHTTFPAHLAIVSYLDLVSTGWKNTHPTALVVSSFLSGTFFPQDHQKITSAFKGAMKRVGLFDTEFVANTIASLADQEKLCLVAPSGDYVKAHDTLTVLLSQIEVGGDSKKIAKKAIVQLRTLLAIIDIVDLPDESIEPLYTLAVSKADGLDVADKKFIKYPLQALEARIVTGDQSKTAVVDGVEPEGDFVGDAL